MSASTSTTIEMIQEPEIALESGLAPDDMVDALGKMLAKYEIPIGLTNKLMALSEFDGLERLFVIAVGLDTEMTNDAAAEALEDAAVRIAALASKLASGATNS